MGPNNKLTFPMDTSRVPSSMGLDNRENFPMDTGEVFSSMGPDNRENFLMDMGGSLVDGKMVGWTSIELARALYFLENELL